MISPFPNEFTHLKNGDKYSDEFKRPQQKESVSRFDSGNDPVLRGVLDILETLQCKFKHKINKHSGVLTLWNIW